MMSEFLNKVVLVTGSSSGIDAETVVEFARRGAQVVVTGLPDSPIAEVATRCDRVAPNSLKAHRVAIDVTSDKDVKTMIDEILAKFGKLDILVNNAGIWSPATIMDANYLDNYDRIIQVN